MSVRKYGASAALAGGAAVAVTVLGISAAHADNGTDQINGWTVTPTGGTASGSLLPPATLSDPSNSLGLGTAPIVGGFDSASAAPLSSIGSDEVFSTPPSTIGTPENLAIQDNWGPGFEEVSVSAGEGGHNFAFLVPAADGNQVVDLFNIARGDAPPLFNPDATGPIYVGGLELASPQDGALLNDLSDAIFTGNVADWANAMTLFDDYLGIDPSSAADAVGMSTAATETPGDVMAQAISELQQGTSVLEAAPTADLGTEWAQYFSNQETSITTLELPMLAHLGALQEGLPSADQAFLAGVDEQLMAAAQNVLSADQSLVVADQAGDLSGNIDFANLPLIEADFGLVSAGFTAIGDTFLAGVFPDIGSLLP